MRLPRFLCQTGFVSPLSLLVLLLLIVGLVVSLKAIQTNQNNKTKAFLPDVTVTGYLAKEHMDNFATNQSEVKYRVVSANGVQTPISPASAAIVANLKPGSQIQARGVKSAGSLSVTSASPTFQAQAQDVASIWSDNPQLYLARVKYQDVDMGLTDSQYKQVVFGDLNKYMNETSYGKKQFTGTSQANVIEMPTTSKCDINAVEKQFVAQNPTIDYNTTLPVVVIRVNDMTCAAGEYTETYVQPDPAKPYTKARFIYIIQNKDFFTTSYASIYTFVGGLMHELGHSLQSGTIGHANGLDCGAISVAPICKKNEYDDPTSMMGGPSSYELLHFNAAQRDYLGWFSSAQISTVTSSGTFTITPIESNTQTLKAIKIRRNADQYYYIEYRQPIGFDQNASLANFAPDMFDGALIHLSDKVYNFQSPLIVDAQPPNDVLSGFGMRHVSLLPGATFTDQGAGITVKLVTKTSGEITVEVTITKPTDTSPPTVSLVRPTNDITIPLGGDLAVDVTGSDDTGLVAVQFNTWGNLINAPTQIVSSAPFSVLWHNVLPKYGPPYGTNFVTVTGYDAAGNASSSKNFGVSFPEPDNQSPSPSPSISPTPTPTPSPSPSISPTPTPSPSPSPICTAVHFQSGVGTVACRSGGTFYYDYTCTNGSKGHLENQTQCQTDAVWQQLADTECVKMTQCITPSVTPSPMLSPTPTPSPSPCSDRRGCLVSPSLSPTPTATMCPRGRCGF